MIGNYGVNRDDYMNPLPTWGSRRSMSIRRASANSVFGYEFLKIKKARNFGSDTRALTRVCQHGTMQAY